MNGRSRNVTKKTLIAKRIISKKLYSFLPFYFLSIFLNWIFVFYVSKAKTHQCLSNFSLKMTLLSVVHFLIIVTMYRLVFCHEVHIMFEKKKVILFWKMKKRFSYVKKHKKFEETENCFHGKMGKCFFNLKNTNLRSYKVIIICIPNMGYL